MHQNLVVILWQFNYSKNGFIVLVLGLKQGLSQTSHSEVERFLNVSRFFLNTLVMVLR